MTARDVIMALLAYDPDSPVWVGKGTGPAGSVESFANPAGEVVLIIGPVTR